ncbi:unnamed protein product [Brassica oleracea]
MSLTGRDSIITKFEERFGRRHVWLRFKNKIDISRKAYIKVKKLIHNRTELIYDAMGRLEMSDAWWDDRIKVTNFLLSVLFYLIYTCELICMLREVHVLC